MRHHLYSAWAVALLGVAVAGAQPGTRKEPVQYAVTERASRVEAPPPGIRLGLSKPLEFALAPLSGSEVSVLSGPGPRMRTGVHRTLPSGILSHGAWEVTSEGARVWRMSLRSPGSSGLRVEFRNFSVGAGSVWLHDGSHVAGPYTGTGLYDDGHFWSAAIPSESVILEYQPGAGVPAEGVPPFEIHTIAHQASRQRSKASLLDGVGLQPSPNAGTTDPADYCHLDPNCYPEWKTAMPMVGQITFEDQGSEYLCSGSLVGTRDNSLKPYFLTAGHCINNEAAARSIEVYWTYQTSTCGGTPPASRDSSTKSTQGGDLIEWATIEDGDYSLVLLKDLPNGVTFSGWDPTDPPVSSALTGIHHPMGSWKRISFGERVADETVDVEGDIAPGNLYLSVLWDKGRTEPGSSGSPLFSSPGVIVGTLTYGPASDVLSACEIQPNVVGYGRFSNAYPALKTYLEDLPASQVTSDKSGLTFKVANHVAPAAQTIHLVTQAAGTVTYKLRADANWLLVSTTTGNVSTSSPATVTISVDPSVLGQPGQYTSTVTILSGAAAPQFINVTATVAVDQSNIVATITPSQVQAASGQWSFTVNLTETAGEATQLTTVKVNGTDYSSSIKSWFGTGQIPAKGSISAPLSGTGGFPKGIQYFEFWGIDDSGQHWYRETTVTFQ
ncbi:MAG TPA: hypothetical protein VKU19_18500 [Bryobacteraceae bacterium]|nr:hypothetical protein [Bryobacteraceae bacterium]